MFVNGEEIRLLLSFDFVYLKVLSTIYPLRRCSRIAITFGNVSKPKHVLT